MTQAACTIVSLNYLPYARVLCASFLRHHPGWKFYVLLVDRLPSDIDPPVESFELVLVEDLQISDFASVAFKYDILELNTNVKPTFLRRLLGQGFSLVVYLDPDIFIYRRLDAVLNALADHALVIVPHDISPNPEEVQAEVIELMGGSFNLGFIALSACAETDRFLAWWEQRCLHFAYNEPKKGMFVDQKWINLVPSYFDRVAILKYPGCNMAYWNLHERELSWNGEAWMVNRQHPLEFYHFSGIAVDGGDKLSRREERFTLANRPELREIYEEYRRQLVEQGINEFKARRYAFGVFDNGQFINRLTRCLYAAKITEFAGDDPFSTSSAFYAWAKSAGLLSDRESAKSYSLESLTKTDGRLRMVHLILRVFLRVLGADRYTVLMKYLSYISILRNQGDVFRH